MSAKVIASAFAVVAILTAQQTGTEIPKQAQRGMELFSEKHCSMCHKLGENGTAIGPDLTGLARVSPKGITVMILATVY